MIPRPLRSTRLGAIARPLRLSTLALALLAAGCSFVPTYQRPAAPIATNWPGAVNEPTDVAPVAELPWQSFFTDPRLSALIEIALFHNRDLRVAALAAEQARALYDIRRADQFPTMNAAATATRAPAVIAGNRTAVTTYNVGLLVTAWEIDFFGRIESLKEAALAQYLASVQGSRAAQISLISAVANTWFALQADQQLLEITRQTLKTRQESQQLAQLRFNNGVSSELDVRQAESLTEAALAALAALQRQRAQDENALVVLVGQPVDMRLIDNTLFGERTPEALGVADVPAGLPSDLLQRRPGHPAGRTAVDRREREHRRRACCVLPAHLADGRIWRGQQPVFRVCSKAARSALPQRRRRCCRSSTDGRNEANLEATRRSASDIAVAQYEKTIQIAFREVADALAGRATLGEQLRATRAQARAESTRFKLADMRYQNGISSYLELLDAQRALFGTQQAIVQIRLAQLQSRVQLYKALGGGWSDASIAGQHAPPTGNLPRPAAASDAFDPAFRNVPEATPADPPKSAPALVPGAAAPKARKQAPSIIKR